MIRRLLALALLLPSLAWADYTTTVAADKPWDWYYLDESSGTAAGDNGSATGTCAQTTHTGTYSGGFTLSQTGLTGAPTHTATKFNGTTGKVVYASNGDNIQNWTINHSATATPIGMSLEAWFKPAAIGVGQAVVANSTAGTANRVAYYLWVQSDNKAHFVVVQASAGCNTFPAAHADIGGTTALAAGTWYYLVGTFLTANATTLSHMRLYVQGSQEATTSSFTGNYNTCSYDFITGNVSAGNWTNGTAAFVAVYNQCADGTGTGELTSTQVTNHYNAGITAPKTGQGWPFTVKRPALPNFLDDGYAEQMVARGYNTGHFTAREIVPQYLLVGYVPFSKVPWGNVGH